MVQVFLGSTVLGLLFVVGSAQVRTPCTNIFSYVRDEKSGETLGRVVIQGAPKAVALHIMVRLSVATALPTKYVGRLELAEPREEAVKAVEQGRPLVYRLHFPIREPVPLVTSILFNNQEYCTGRRAIGPIVTSITLEHTLYPPGVTSPLDNKPDSTTAGRLPSSDVTFPTNQDSRPVMNPNVIPTQKPIRKPTQKPNIPSVSPDLTITESVPPRDSGIYNDCGRPNKSDINLLIAKGERTSPGDWPWVVAIFVARIKLEFQCAGSLITEKHVLTAAHCLKRDDGPELPASTLLAALGRYRLRNWDEKGSVTYEISEFRLHPEYGHRSTGFDYDLGIMVLMETVTFGRLIQPVCLWSGSAQIESVVGIAGFVVGWGRDEQGNPITPEPKMARVTIVSQEECLRSNADFIQITSNGTFCAGGSDGGGPCNGDSGAGLVIRDPQTHRYHLRGIVSLSLLDKNTGACDLTQFVVYTDAAKYRGWIQEQLTT